MVHESETKPGPSEFSIKFPGATGPYSNPKCTGRQQGNSALFMMMSTNTVQLLFANAGIIVGAGGSQQNQGAEINNLNLPKFSLKFSRSYCSASRL